MTTLYETDFLGWAQMQSLLLKKKDFSSLDISNLIEEIDDLGNSKHTKMESLLRVILCHLLKIKFQPEKHTASWDRSVNSCLTQAKRLLRKNPSLKHYLKEIFMDAYEDCIPWAADETGLDEEIFPKECPWTIEEILEEKK